MSALFFRTFLSRSRTACRRRPLSASLLLQSTAGGRAYATSAGPRTVRLSYALAAATLLGSTSYLIGAFAPPQVIRILSPRPAPPPPPADSPEGREHVERIERELQTLPLLQRFRQQADADEWYEIRPYVTLTPERRVNNFTAGTLSGPGKVAVPPLVRARKDEKEAWIFVHLGGAICGHPGIVHGGLLMTILDEACARSAVFTFPSHVPVTANINFDFKAPTKAEEFVVVKTRLVEHAGRKATVEAHIEDLHGNVLVKARGLFIEPKFAKAINLANVSGIFPGAGQAAMEVVGAPPGQTEDKGSVKSG